MPTKKRVPADANVVWFSPELLGREPGEYRVHVKDVEDGGRLVAEFSDDLVVWVDDAPDDPADGSGHFEFFNGDAADYRPLVRVAS